jgi:hypothetical protein
MSQYIATLNTDTPSTEDFLANDDLSLFATTEFFDFDMGEQLNLPGDFESSISNNKKSSTAGWQAGSGTASGQDFLDGKSHIAVNCFLLHHISHSHSSTIILPYSRHQQSALPQPETFKPHALHR